MAHPIPNFSDLPLDPNGPHHNAWGLYGKTDQLGTLNRLIDPLIVSTAATEIRTGVRISLDWPLDAQSDLPFFGRQAFHKQVYQKAPRIVNDDVWTFNTQSSSQWDGLRHFGYQKEEVFYNGVTLADIHGGKGDVNGIQAWAEKGIVGRGVLLDYHEWRLKNQGGEGGGGGQYNAFETAGISAAELKAVARAQGTEIQFGDVLLIRSGYMDAYNRLSRAEIMTLRERQPLRFVGVEQSDEMMEFLWGHFSAVAGDQPSFEAWPTQREFALHEVLLGGWGMPIGELFDLEKLGRHCKAVGRWSFFLTSEPCNVPGGVASPPNALAIF
ncbi:hypothetical protein EJ03DRAFT_217646 [Teratosphaeria nubilosa]|uniref:Cyclase n=1 Tax=Teratosphaeria nubilosa TaxID=161662 RepID=A0A6G1KX97_9PEZI|nr:hypothetical protein EJ03DRAFT_217646 [Teratosphaeria nubilosa]